MTANAIDLEVQTRSEENGIKLFPTIAEAIHCGEQDPTVWKISFNVSGERVRLVRHACGWVYSAILDELMVDAGLGKILVKDEKGRVVWKEQREESPFFSVGEVVQHKKTKRVGEVTGFQLGEGTDIMVNHTGPYPQIDFVRLKPET